LISGRISSKIRNIVRKRKESGRGIYGKIVSIPMDLG
jgi:hypothetical protein